MLFSPFNFYFFLIHLSYKITILLPFSVKLKIYRNMPLLPRREEDAKQSPLHEETGKKPTTEK